MKLYVGNGKIKTLDFISKVFEPRSQKLSLVTQKLSVHQSHFSLTRFFISTQLVHTPNPIYRLEIHIVASTTCINELMQNTSEHQFCQKMYAKSQAHGVYSLIAVVLYAIMYSPPSWKIHKTLGPHLPSTYHKKDCIPLVNIRETTNT